MEKIKGRIWKLGDSVDTDVIVPSRVLTEQDEKKLLAATLENVKPAFTKDVSIGDVIIAGKNFGCGSSREEAVFVLKKLGIRAIIAKSFARIFYRNCINLGLPPILLLEGKPESLGEEGQTLEIDFEKGTILSQHTKKQHKFLPFPPFVQDILSAGGAIPYINAQK
jgi:3-isopropylmalate/(R)-2-methylmalate dehydratase small subunit